MNNEDFESDTMGEELKDIQEDYSFMEEDSQKGNFGKFMEIVDDMTLFS